MVKMQLCPKDWLDKHSAGTTTGHVLEHGKNGSSYFFSTFLFPTSCPGNLPIAVLNRSKVQVKKTQLQSLHDKKLRERQCQRSILESRAIPVLTCLHPTCCTARLCSPKAGQRPPPQNIPRRAVGHPWAALPLISP